MLPEKAMLDVLAVGIQVIQDNIGIAGVAGCEYDDFEVFAQIFEDILCMGTDVDSCLDDFSSGESDG